MKVLVLGGTRFVGRAIVERLIKDDSLEVSLCNRGQSNTDLFAQLPLIKADREQENLASIVEGSWDAVIDVSSYYPDSLAAFLDGMKGRIGRYIYISTGSVYRFGVDPSPYTEESPVQDCLQEYRADQSMLTYGARKAACEKEIMGRDLDALIFRPGVIFGHHDPTDRHYYWLHKVRMGQEMVVPDAPAFEAHTYASDLAEVVHHALRIESHRSIYNLPTHEPVRMRDLAAIMSELLASQPELKLFSPEKLMEAKVQPGQDLPLWWGPVELRISADRLRSDFKIGWTSLRDALADTLSWYESKGWPDPVAGWSRKKELEFLADHN